MHTIFYCLYFSGVNLSNYPETLCFTVETSLSFVSHINVVFSPSSLSSLESVTMDPSCQFLAPNVLARLLKLYIFFSPKLPNGKSSKGLGQYCSYCLPRVKRRKQSPCFIQNPQVKILRMHQLENFHNNHKMYLFHILSYFVGVCE